MPEPKEVHRIFTLACELTGDAREASLAENCGSDLDLRAAVEQLLGHDGDTGHLGERQMSSLRARLLGDTDVMPTRIGTFRVVAEIGRGGMGIVYRAEQNAPERQVALKVLAPSLAGEEASQRFAAEAEALGRLQHQGIAQIYEAGHYEVGGAQRPYLAMELVDGVPLVDWLRERRPTREARIDVLIQLCEAVHHAHQKGLIHRDLKPSNVLVDRDDCIKVLDFGIARFVSNENDRSLLTRTGQLLGTLAYMSPEQAGGLIERIDVRTDVYAIGVIAYELLGGCLPIDVREEPLMRAVRRIVDEQPTALGLVDRTLRGDLETVVAKALRKEPDRRYGSAQAFADDLRCVQVHLPVTARPATASYVFRRFARRHAGLVAGAFVAMLAIGGGVTASTIWALRADQAQRAAATEAEVAQRVFGFVRTMFQAAAPKVALGKDITAKELTLEGAAKIGTELREEPALLGRLGRFLGETLVEMGEFEAGRELLADSIEALRDADIAGDILAQTLSQYGRTLARTGRLDDAEVACQEALTHLGDGDVAKVTRANVCGTRAVMRRDVGKFDDALELLEEARSIHKQRGDQASLAEVWAEIASVHQVSGKLPLANEAFEKSLSLTPADVNPLQRAIIATNLGNLRIAQRRVQEAEALFRESLALGEEYLGPQHPLLIRRLCNLAGVCGAQRKLDEAEKHLVRAVALGDSVDSRYDDGVANACTNLGNVRAMKANLDEAFALWQRAAKIYERRAGPDSRDLADVLENMAIVHEQKGERDQAKALRKRVAAIRAGG